MWGAVGFWTGAGGCGGRVDGSGRGWLFRRHGLGGNHRKRSFPQNDADHAEREGEGHRSIKLLAMPAALLPMDLELPEVGPWPETVVGLAVEATGAFFDGAVAERGAGRDSPSSADATPLGLGKMWDEVSQGFFGMFIVNGCLLTTPVGAVQALVELQSCNRPRRRLYRPCAALPTNAHSMRRRNLASGQ